MKYHIIVYGCQMNFADAEKICASLEQKGYKKTADINEANLVAIVMCSVRQAAVDRIFGLVEKFKKLNGPKGTPPKTLLTGCVLKKDKKTFSQIFDDVIDIKEIQKYKPKYSGQTKAFLTISNGCNNFCTYCVVPYTRGRLTCISHKKIIKEAEGLIKNGAKEIWLLGQNVNDYTSPADKSVDFPKLLELVCNLSGEFKVFFMSPNPKNFSDKLILAMKNANKFSRYLNLPVQSGDDEILKKMNRPYASGQYINLVKKIRKAMPDINLSTDVIVGFPSETKKQFDNTVKLFKKVKFNIAYINKYSPRRGTAAFKMEDNVPFIEKKRREQILIKLVNAK